MLQPNGARRTARRTPPGPTGNLLLAAVRALRREPLQWLTKAAREHGDVVRFRVGPATAILINRPDLIEYVLQDNARNYRKGRALARSRPLMGRGLLTNEGDSWLRQRRMAQPAFHRQRIVGMANSMTEQTVRMLQRWEGREATQPFDVAEEMMRLTLAIAGQTLFGADVEGDAPAVGSAMIAAQRFARTAMSPLGLVPGLPLPQTLRFREAIRLLDSIVYRLIATRRHTNLYPDDLLSLLLQARDLETGQGMTDQQLRDEVMTLFLAGHETTANALAWTWYLLSRHPHVERRVRDELDVVLEGRLPTTDDTRRLAYTTAVLQETMRLYPPAWVMGREAIQDDEIDGYHVPAGATVLISPWVMHRHPAYWENPEGFDPERFMAARSLGRPRYVYFPFGGGQRMCIGQSFAMLEAQLVVATVAQRYRLHLVPGYPVEPEPLVTLRPRQGVWVELKEQQTMRR